jgi:hypothetical protein
MALRRQGGTRRAAGRPGLKAEQKTLQVGVPERYIAFITGEMTVEDLDDEEVMRGQLRNKNGDFSGRKPNAVPREFMNAILIEQQRRFQGMLGEQINVAMDTLMEVMQKAHPQPGDAARVKAATYIIDRFAGKTPENVSLKAEVTSKFENVAHDILIDVDAKQGEDDELGDI